MILYVVDLFNFLCTLFFDYHRYSEYCIERYLMGNGNSSIANDADAITSKVDTPYDKVMLYTKPNLQGDVYVIDYGSYTSTLLIPVISPNNVFSLSIPPYTSVKMYCGDLYDYGGKGSIEITNVTSQKTDVPSLPDNIQGGIRSISINKYSLNTPTDFHQQSAVSMKNKYNELVLEPFEGHYHHGFVDFVYLILIILLAVLIVDRLRRD
jgi:hypothetical protein